tara:strand:- start:1026 stop:1253 length:228 start_codon:yes stop_codon:yes gene_type:complete
VVALPALGTLQRTDHQELADQAPLRRKRPRRSTTALRQPRRRKGKSNGKEVTKANGGTKEEICQGKIKNTQSKAK